MTKEELKKEEAKLEVEKEKLKIAKIELAAKVEAVREKFVDRLATLVTAAFGLVAALAWNDTIRAIFTEVFGTPNHIGASLIYSIIVTLIAVIAIMLVNRAASTIKGK